MNAVARASLPREAFNPLDSVKRRFDATPYLYLAPLLLLLGVFTFWPLLHTVYLSLVSWNLNPDQPTRFVGLDNYAGVMRSSLFAAAAWNTVVYIAASVPLKVLAPIPVAIFLWSLHGGGQIYRTLLFLPTLCSFVAVAVAWLWLLNPMGGYLQLIAKAAGFHLPALLHDGATALWTVLGIASWKLFGFHVLLYLAGLARIDRSLVEAMRVDGARDLQIVRHLVWPMLGPTTLFVLVSTAIFTTQQVFTPIDVLTKGGPANSTTNLFYVVYQYAFVTFNVGYGAAATVLLLILVGLVTWMKFTLFERRIHYRD